jgi:O-6-methylguanine DNA methyltransferase
VVNDVEDRLRALHAAAPDHLLPRVLVATGIADQYVLRDSAAGPIIVAWNRHGISAVRLGGDPVEFEQWFAKRRGRVATRGDALPDPLHRAVDRALATGDARALTYDLRALHEFEIGVLRAALSIPPGEVRPYAWVAREAGRPAAVRAAGTALGANPIPLLIPCHRVVYSDGTSGHYAFGPEVKRALLTHEGIDLEALARGPRLVGSDTTRIYCHPTCRDAKRIGAAHRVGFRSAADATAAGYRACQHCRPAA